MKLFALMVSVHLLPAWISGDAVGWVKTLESRYRSSKTLQANFLERYTEDQKTVRVEAGQVYFRRPGKMRWEYEAPERNLFLVDGKTAWFYVPGDHTVMRVPAKQSTDLRTPLALLAGEMKVSRICDRVELAAGETPESAANVVLRCRVRGADSRQRRDGSDSAKPADVNNGDIVLFEIVRESGELVRLLVRQSAGVQVEFKFAKWQINPPVPDSLFRFEVPFGVAIVNGELPSEETAVK
jgi:outer membrane lipoprotein carrier protein